MSAPLLQGIKVLTLEQVPDFQRLGEAIDALAVHDRRKAELVKHKYFAGLQLEETAQVLGISLATAKRDWAYARTWLYNEVNRLRG